MLQHKQWGRRTQKGFEKVMFRKEEGYKNLGAQKRENPSISAGV